MYSSTFALNICAVILLAFILSTWPNHRNVPFSLLVSTSLSSHIGKITLYLPINLSNIYQTSQSFTENVQKHYHNSQSLMQIRTIEIVRSRCTLVYYGKSFYSGEDYSQMYLWRLENISALIIFNILCRRWATKAKDFSSDILKTTSGNSYDTRWFVKGIRGAVCIRVCVWWIICVSKFLKCN